MMEILFAIFYITIFCVSFLKRNYIVAFLPIFIFCYPHNLPYINIGFGVGIDDLFLLLHFVRSSIEPKSDVFRSSIVRKWRIINLLVIIVYVLSNLIGFAGDQFSNLIVLDFIKGTLLFSYTYFICYIYLINVNSLPQIYNAKIALIAAVVYQSVIAFLVYHYTETFSFFYDSSDILLSGEVAFRAVGSLKGPWELGGFLSIGYVLIYSELIYPAKKTKLLRVLFFCSLLVVLYSIVISTSRASWLFVTLSTVVLFLKKPTKQVFYFLGIFCVAITISYSYISDAIDLIIHRVNYTTSSNQGNLDNSSEQRFMIWQRLFNEYSFFYSIFGYGWQNFIRLFSTTPHNGYLSLFTSSGLVGIIIYFRYFSLILQANSSYKKQFHVDFGVSAILFGLAVYSITTDTLYTNAVFKILTIIGSLAVIQSSVFTKKSAKTIRYEDRT